MALIPYNTTSAYGKETAEIIATAIVLKARAAAHMALINEASAGGTIPANLEGGDFGVPTSSGPDFYTLFHESVNLNISAIPDTALAQLNRGGVF